MARSAIARAARREAASRSEGSGAGAAKRILWFVGLFAWVFVAGAVLSHDPADPPGLGVAPLNAPDQLGNWMGPAGAMTAHHLASMLGSGLWIVLLSIAGWLAHVAWKGPVDQLALRVVGVLMLALALSGFHALLAPEMSRFPEGGGGLLAIFGAGELSGRFGTLGAGLWILLLGAVGVIVAYDDLIVAIPRAALARAGRLSTHAPSALRLGAEAGGRLGGRLARAAASVRENDVDDDERLRVADDPYADIGDEEEPERAAPKRIKPKAQPKPQPKKAPKLALAQIEEDEEPAQEEIEEAAPLSEEQLREKIAKLPVRFAGSVKSAASEEDLLEIRARNMNEEADRAYVFPGLDLLEEPEASFGDELSEFVREQAESLERALQTYGIDGEVAGIDSGPVITLYQVRLAEGTKVSSITSVSSDLARALKAVNIRIVPNTEGLDTVGIEVPNRKKEKVRLKELMTCGDATNSMRLPLFLGKDASGNPLVQDLASMPHMLIAGTTGSGKSVCMNAIIMGFLYTQKPSDLKLVLVDPKMVELSQFKHIPHLMCPVVTDMAKAAAILEWAVAKMDERYELLAEAGCRDINAYNSLGWEELKERFEPENENEEARIPRKLPYMVFVIDELADLMMTNKEVENSIVRIAQKARAVGIHLILATQRPQANVVTGLIKSNMPARVAFKVASGMDSRIVLDQKGGELLLGQGDMLMITPRSSTPMRAQGTLVDDVEIRRVARFIRDVSEPTYERQLMQIRSDGTPERGSADHEAQMLRNAQEDPLFDRAVEIVLETRRGSVSLLQRRLAIGYTRSSRLIELMGMAGIIGGHKGSVAREVLITLEEWEAMKAVAAKDAAVDDEEGASTVDTSTVGKQTALFPGPVIAREILESKEAAEIVASDHPTGEQAYNEEEELDDEDAIAEGSAEPTQIESEVEEAPFDVDEDEEEAEAEPEAEADEHEEEDDEAAEIAEVEEDAEDEATDDSEYAIDGDGDESAEYEYEYEYVEAEGEEEADADGEVEYELVDEESDAEPEDEYEDAELEAEDDTPAEPEIKTLPRADERQFGKAG